MSIKRVFCLLCICCPVLLMGQQIHNKPDWVRKHLPVPGNNTYIFVKQTAISQSLGLARQSCMNQLANDRTVLNGAMVYSQSNSSTRISQEYIDGKFSENISDNIDFDLKIEGIPFKLQTKVIDEYYTKEYNNGSQCYNMSVLYMVAVRENPIFDYVNITSKYGFQHVWPSFIVPGAGQMVKGDWLKGGLMMGGATLFAGGIALTECTRQVYLGKISQQSRNEEAVKIYANRASNLAIGRNICIGGLCAVYIYSIIDAFVAPGARRVEVIPNGIAVNF